MSFLGRGNRRGRRPAALVVAGALFAFQALAIVGAQVALAATNCTFAAGTISISMDATESHTFSVGTFDAIEMDAAQTCDTGNFTGATLNNTTLVNIVGDGDDQDITIDAAVDWGTLNWAINLSGGTDSFTVDNALNTDSVDQEWGANGVDLNADGDLDVTVAGVEEFIALAGDGGDVINAGGGTATGAAFADDIIITGGTGGDTLTGGAGDDTVSGGAGDDVIAGGDGNDTLAGGTDTDGDTLDYSGSSAGVTGTLNSLFQGQGVDSTAEFENLIGSPQADNLTGDGGDNVITPGLGDDTVDGAAGTGDTIDYSDAPAAVEVDLDAGTATGGSGNDTLSNFENAIGSAFNDTLVGDSGDNSLMGGDGNDVLAGGAGTNTLAGQAGIDTVDYGWASTAVVLSLNCLGTAGSATGPAADTIHTIENAILTAGDDSFIGNEFPNTVWPNGGQNSLNGDGTCLNSPAGGGDSLDYGVGYESGVNVNMAGGGTAGDSAVGFENARGTAFNDTFVGNSDSNRIAGRGGNDSLRLGSGDDTGRGGPGKDRIRAGSGDDNLIGGKGNDSLFGGGGDDLGRGGPGKDVCKGVEIKRSCGTAKNPKAPVGLAARLV